MCRMQIPPKNILYTVMFKEKAVKYAVVFLLTLFVITYADESFAKEIMFNDMLSKFKQQTLKWEDVITNAAKSLFRWLLIIEVAWMGIRMALKPADIKEILVEFVKLILFAGFMYALIVNYADWTNSIINGFTKLGESASSGSPKAEPNAIFMSMLTIVIKMFKKCSSLGLIMNGYKVFGMAISSVVMIICYALIIAQMVLVRCESYIVLTAGMILLGFGGSQFTKDFATNFMKYALGVAVKLYVMQLLVSIGITIIDDLGKSGITFNDIFVLIGTSIVLLALVQSLPDIASGIISGSHVSTGRAINSAVTAVATGTMAAMSGGVSGVAALSQASKFASAEGKSGMGKLGHMAGTLGNAMKASKNPSFGQKVASNVAAQHESYKMEKQAAADAAAKPAGSTPSGDGEG